jgi:hypothetical protein
MQRDRGTAGSWPRLGRAAGRSGCRQEERGACNSERHMAAWQTLCTVYNSLVSELLLTPRIQLSASNAYAVFCHLKAGRMKIWLGESFVTRFLALLSDRAVAPTTPGGPLGVHCTGRQSACRTASNIDRVASRLGFVRPIDYMHNGHQRLPRKVPTIRTTPLFGPILQPPFQLFPGAVTSISS